MGVDVSDGVERYVGDGVGDSVGADISDSVGGYVEGSAVGDGVDVRVVGGGVGNDDT